MGAGFLIPRPLFFFMENYLTKIREIKLMLDDANAHLTETKELKELFRKEARMMGARTKKLEDQLKKVEVLYAECALRAERALGVMINKAIAAGQLREDE